MTDYAQRRRIMVDTQVRPSDVTKFPIIDAMLATPREIFVPDNRREAAYIGENIDLGSGRVVLDPRTLSKMLNTLDVRPSDLVLDVAANLGYSTAILARLAEAVVAVEEDEQMASDAEAALAEIGADNAAVVTGSLAEGAAQHGPYDVIVVQGGVQQVPDALIDQLAENGRICCLFMEGALGVVRIGRKIDGVVSWREAFNATAPLLPGFERKREFVL